MNDIDPIALFRLSVLGPLASRDRLQPGELKRLVRQLAATTYHIPNSTRVRLSEATIQRWYYAWKRGGIEALAPRIRRDRGHSQLPPTLQQAILNAKQANPARSINTIIRLLEHQGTVGKGQLARSSVHRLLKQHQLSTRQPAPVTTIERRRFVAEHINDLWQGDVLHGPTITLAGRRRKLYLVSLMDDASRLITHSEFRLGETALDIQAVLKQALLKRGIPHRLLLDNGAAYRSRELQAICARLKIRVIYCRPYQPQAKGKIERWHARFRQEFLAECDCSSLDSLDDINARLWAYLDHVYHPTAHTGLEGQSPQQRWRQQITHVRSLGVLVHTLDDLFDHRQPRRVRNDGCVSFQGHAYEVPYELCGQLVRVVFDPHTQQVKSIESMTGQRLGDAVPVDPIHNHYRRRRRPTTTQEHNPSNTVGNAIELAYQDYQKTLLHPTPKKEH